MVIGDVECQQCNKIINWSGECDCKPPYKPMSDMEYRARFTHPRNAKGLNGSDQVKH
jgi:hypothetical protein